MVAFALQANLPHMLLPLRQLSVYHSSTGMSGLLPDSCGIRAASTIMAGAPSKSSIVVQYQQLLLYAAGGQYQCQRLGASP